MIQKLFNHSLFKRRREFIVCETDTTYSLTCSDTGLLLVYEVKDIDTILLEKYRERLDLEEEIKVTVPVVVKEVEEMYFELPKIQFTREEIYEENKRKYIEYQESKGFSFDSKEKLEDIQIDPLKKEDMELIEKLFPSMETGVKKDVVFSSGLIIRDATRDGVIQYIQDVYY